MRLHRFLIPLVAGITLLGVFIALGIALSRGRGLENVATTGPLSSAEVGELLAIKNEAEALAIADKLAEAHAKYRELFSRAQGRDIKDPAFWDLLERAKIDQDRIYVILLSQHDPARILTPPLPNNGTTTAAASAPATTQSFVDVHPPYSGVAKEATTQATSKPAVAMATSPPATISTATSTTVPATARGDLPAPRNLKIARTPIDPSGFSDVMVGQSLAAANEFLIAQFKDGEITQGKEYSETYRQGLNALCVYALLHSGEATRDARLAPTSEFMRAAVEKLKLQPMATDTSKAQQPVVYARSLRAAVLARSNRPEDRDLLKDDVKWLIDAAVDGAYTYDDRFTVKVIPADPRGAGRTKNVPLMPPPEAPGPKPAKPKTLGPTKSDQPDAQPAPAAPAGQPGNGKAAAAAREAAIFGLEKPPEAPLPIQLADGLHDPKTGRELGPPPRFPQGYPPGTMRPPPIYPPQELPEKYGGPFVWDNSNSQYGLLGVWAGAEVGIEVPDAYWAAVEKHWLSCQLEKGEWPYRKEMPTGRLAMTSAGIASLLITSDYLEAPTIAKLGQPQASPAAQALMRAFGWLEQGDNVVDVSGPRTVYLGYTLHALSRVGLASGYKYLGSHDWYRSLSRKIVLSQWESGAWGRRDEASADTLVDTAYSMLFLARGRHPVLMNKLRLDEAGRTDRGAWNNRPRDLANLARFASRELERPLNWQIVSIDRDASDWSDAPILYLASHAALKLTDAEVAKIRAFVDGGGMLFTQADNGSESFNLYVNQLAKRLFPETELKDLSIDDELYSLQYIIAKPNRPRLRAIGNGSRLLWVHSPTDVAVSWQQRAEKTQRTAFEMGVNLFVYAGGKADLRNRLDDRAIPAPNFVASSTIAVARLKYDGAWDPEPAAWPRFARYLQWETSITTQPKVVDLTAQGAALSAKDFPIAHLCGSAGFAPTEAQLKVLRDYVTGGGVLIAEAVGGADSPFADALQSAVLPRAFPGARFEPLVAGDPMLHASFKGMEDVWPPRLRPYAAQKLGKEIPAIRTAGVGNGRVIYLPLDTTTGLLGASTWPIFGYEPHEAAALMKNIILWSAEQAAP